MELDNIRYFLSNKQESTINSIFRIEKINRSIRPLNELALNLISLKNQGILKNKQLLMELDPSYSHFVNITRPLRVLSLDYYVPVSIRQYDRILKRRKERKGEAGVNKMRHYFYESRHRIALKRKRGKRGRFLPSKKKAECYFSYVSYETKKDTESKSNNESFIFCNNNEILT